MSNENTNLVWAIFPDKNMANGATTALKKWDKANKDIKLGAIGVVYKNDKGKLKAKRHGTRSFGRGATIGVVAGVLTAVLPGIGLLAGAVTGTAVGTVLGGFHKDALGLSDEQKDDIKAKLDADKVLVMVLCDGYEVDATKAELSRLGGETNSSVINEEAIDAADQAMAEAGIAGEVEIETE